MEAYKTRPGFIAYASLETLCKGPDITKPVIESFYRFISDSVVYTHAVFSESPRNVLDTVVQRNNHCSTFNTLVVNNYKEVVREPEAAMGSDSDEAFSQSHIAGWQQGWK